MTRWRGTVTLAACLVLLWGCAGLAQRDGRSFGARAETAGAGAVAASTAPAPARALPPASHAKERKFGRTFRYGSGLAVTVEPPEPFRPSSWIVREPGEPLRFRVTVHNGTQQEWKPSQLHVRLTSGFIRAKQIYDAEKHVVARPENRLPPGRDVTFHVGYWVPDPSTLALEFAPGFGYSPTIVRNMPR